MALVLAVAPGASSWQPVGFGFPPRSPSFQSVFCWFGQASIFTGETAPPDPSPTGLQLAGPQR